MAALLISRFPEKAPGCLSYQAAIVRAERNYFPGRVTMWMNCFIVATKIEFKPWDDAMAQTFLASIMSSDTLGASSSSMWHHTYMKTSRGSSESPMIGNTEGRPWPTRI